MSRSARLLAKFAVLTVLASAVSLPVVPVPAASAGVVTVPDRTYSSRSMPFLSCGGASPCGTGHWSGNGAHGQALLVSNLHAGQIIRATVSGTVNWGGGAGLPNPSSCRDGNGSNHIPKQVAFGQFVNAAGQVVNAGGVSGGRLLRDFANGVAVPTGAVALYGSFPDSRYDDNNGNCSFTGITVTTRPIEYTPHLTGPSSVQPSTAYTYNYTYTKSGPGLYWGVRTVLTAPAGAVINHPDANNICTGNGTNRVVCTAPAGDRSPTNTSGGQPFTVRTPATCPASQQFIVTAVATVLGTEDSNPNNNSVQVTSTFPCQPTQQTLDYGVDLSGPSTVQPSIIYTYTLNTSKSGTATVWGATEVLNFPAGSVVLSVGGDVNNRCSGEGTNQITCVHPVVTRTGTEGTLTFQVRMPAVCPAGQQAVASVSATTQGATDTNLSNNNDQVVSTFTGCAPPPTFQCSDGQDNDGDNLIDFPQDPGCTSAQDNDEFNAPPPTFQCSDGQDNDGDNLIDFPQDPGCTSAQDNDEFNQPPPQGANLSVTKSGPSTVTRGGTISYSIRVSNAGPAAASNIVANDPFPAGFTFNAGQSTSDCSLVGASVRCTRSSLAAGQSATSVIVFNVPAQQNCTQTSVTNTATVSSSTTDPVPSNNTSQTVSTTVQCPQPVPECRDGQDNDGDGLIDMQDPGCDTPDDDDETDTQQPQCSDNQDNDGDGLVDFPQDPGCTSAQDNDEFNQPPPQGANLSVSKSGPSTVTRGSAISYTVTVFNAGPGAAGNVIVNDPFPAGFTFNAQQSPGCSLVGASVRCTTASNLSAGATRSYTLVFNVPTVANCTQTSVTNTATVSSSTTDPVPSNNTSQTVSTTVQCPQPVPECRDGQDNDGDGLIDLQDPGCTHPDDDDETNPTVPQCSDGIDNDGDGRTDYFDPGCYPNGVFDSISYNPNDNNEGGDTVFGCIQVIKQAFTQGGAPITPVPQFRFTLNGRSPRLNSATGTFTYWNVVPGFHTVAETVPQGWTQIGVTPAGGQITVNPGSQCAQVRFQNRQLVP